MSAWPEEKIDRMEAEDQACAAKSRKDVRAWLRKLKWLCDNIPEGCWVYSECSDPHLMAMSPDGAVYMTDVGGACQGAIVGSGSGGIRWDSGAW